MLFRSVYLVAEQQQANYGRVSIDEPQSDDPEELKNSIKAKEHVNITNFGVFNKTLIKPKVMYSPTDGKTLKVDGYYRINFTCSKKFIEELKGE